MAVHSRFNAKTKEDFLNRMSAMNIELPWSDQLGIYAEAWNVGEIQVSNRLLIHPMEGFDAEKDGGPGLLTFRRYQRFLDGGAGLIWLEATSVARDGKSNPRQLYLQHESLDGYKRLVDQIHQHERPVIIQLTHSGRYSKPDGSPAPMIASVISGIDNPDARSLVVSDQKLEIIRDQHIAAAGLAAKAGFDGVDIKACHGYLYHELLSSINRLDSIYGGALFENRIRLLLETIRGIRKEYPGLLLSVRLNVCDMLPGRFGMSGDSKHCNLDEPIELIKILGEEGVQLLSVSAGIPYLNPWVGRPFDKGLEEAKTPPEHPLDGVARMVSLTKICADSSPVPVVGAGLSWLRQFFPYIGAGILESRNIPAIGLGRMSFAYPDFAKDLLQKGYLDPRKVCVSCSGCTNRMRNFQEAGCIIRDNKVYASRKS